VQLIKSLKTQRKVLQVIASLSAGGAEGFVTNLSVSLAGLDVEVRVFVMAGVRRERGQVLLRRLEDAGIEVIGVEERKPASLGNLIQLTHLIRSWRPDIVQANLYASEVACVGANILSLRWGTCMVRRLTGTGFVGYRSPTIIRLLDRFFRQTIACSPMVAEAYREFMGVNSKSHLVTIPNGGLLLDSVPNSEEKCRARKQLDIPEEAFVVSHIGRMLGGAVGTGLEAEPKAQDVLLQAFAKAFGGDPNCVLVLVGDGPLRPEAEKLAERLGVAKQARFLGQQPEPWPALQAADLFCFPSRHEGLPNVLPEAASCGLPVVASDIPEIRFLYPGDAWLLAPVDDVSRFADAMVTVRADLQLFKRRAHAAADGFRRQFSMTACAEKYLQVYESALGRSKKSENRETS